MSWLSPAEQKLFARMSNSDQRHAVDVAHRAEVLLVEDPPDAGRSTSTDVVDVTDVMAAALLHDVGKVVAGLGLYGRVVATLSGVVAGADYAEAWQEKSGFPRRVGLYLRYGELGADLLRMAEASPLVVSWAAEHHLPEDRWTIPPDVGRILVAADR